MSKGLALAGLGRCEETDSDDASAQQRYTDVLTIGRAAGEPGLTAAALEGLARVAARAREHATGRKLTDEAHDIRMAFVRPTPPYERVQEQPVQLT